MKMANLAQMVNVLQSVILTEGADMVLTPTYHVFDMYKDHQNAMLLDSSIEAENIGLEAEYQVPNLTESVSVAEDGTMHITVTNASLDQDIPVEAFIVDRKVNEVSGQIVGGEMHQMNTFEDPENVTVRVFDGAVITESGISFTIPASSVVHLIVK